MLSDLLPFLNDPNARISENGKILHYKGQDVPIKNGIPRFTPDLSYSTGNFSKLREKHAELQLDSRNNSGEREMTILERCQWPPDFFKGKTILECGCGAGPDTEIFRKYGAKVVAVDIAGVDIAKANLNGDEGVFFVQGSILDLPFRKESFDIVWCHRVIQHTPEPKETFKHIIRYVKPDGAFFVHSYARSWAQMLRWKYALRPITKRQDPEKLYNFIKSYAPAAYKLTGFLRKIPGGRYFNHFFVPFLNYRHAKRFEKMNDEQIMELAIHDTFDALSPAYDNPLCPAFMETVANENLKVPFELEKRHMSTFLRTKNSEENL